MSAAQELAERDFKVEVYEKLSIPGGKARSMKAANVGARGSYLPGEHGFRFFPGFYRHISDSMRRIPFENGKTVFDNLVPATELGFARDGKKPLLLKAQLPLNPKTLLNTFKSIRSHVEIPDDEFEFFSRRVLQLMTSCTDRRLAEYEQLGWAEFMESEGKSKEFVDFLVKGITKTLVAAKAEKASTYTIGNTYLQLLFDILDSGSDVDRLLNGPSNDVWIEPWRRYLEQLGVNYITDSEVQELHTSGEAISGVTARVGDETKMLQGDYYVAALPVEAMSQLLRNSDNVTAIDPTLKYLHELSNHIEWMTGIQIYLKQDVKVSHGHLNYVESDWALTSISQAQFWTQDYKPEQFGDSDVKGIISVCISDWDTPGSHDKIAKESTKQEIFEEVWQCLKASMIDDSGNPVLNDDLLIGYHLDPSIEFSSGPAGIPVDNDERLLVNLVNMWGLRPEAYTRIPNLFLASDYVRTNTDLATMEAANEAARRAVNCILDRSQPKRKWFQLRKTKRCRIWALHEPGLLKYWRDKDRKRFKLGLPWQQEMNLKFVLEPRFWLHILKWTLSRISKPIRHAST